MRCVQHLLQRTQRDPAVTHMVPAPAVTCTGELDEVVPERLGKMYEAAVPHFKNVMSALEDGQELGDEKEGWKVIPSPLGTHTILSMWPRSVFHCVQGVLLAA